MRTGDLILGAAVAVGLFLAFSVGQKQGLKTAPEYVAMKERERAEIAAQMAAWEAEYEGSPDQVCDRIIEMVVGMDNATMDDHREPDPYR